MQYECFKSQEQFQNENQVDLLTKNTMKCI